MTQELIETAKELQKFYENNIGVGDIDNLLSFADSAKDFIDAVLSNKEKEDEESTYQPPQEGEMEVRVTYRSEVYVKGKDLEDCRKAWCDMNLKPIGDNGTWEFVEKVSAERVDDNSYDEVEL